MDLYQQTTFESYAIRKKDGYDAFTEDGVCYLFWNTPDYAGLNGALCDDINAEKLGRIKERTKGRNFSVASKTPADSSLLSQGLRYDETANVMQYKLKNKLGYKSDLKITKVSTPEELLNWASVPAKVFHLKDADYIYNMCKGDLGIPEVTYFFGEAGGKIIGAIQTVKGSKASGIYWVSVDEDFRHRGYAQDLMAAAMNDALDNGCNTFVLCSSTKGLPLYKKMGFDILYERYDYELENDVK